jgi:importin subunit alpha-1
MFRSNNKPTNRSFKKTIDADDARRKRADITISLRKQQREENAMKRRMKGATAENNENTAASALNSVNLNKKLTPEEVQQRLKNIHELVNGVNSDNVEAQSKCTSEFRRLLSIENQPPIQRVIETGIVPRLVSFLMSTNSTLQFEAAWTLTNIASGTTQHTQCVIKNGAVPHFVKLLSSSNPDIREQAVWALGNIAGDHATYRDLVLQHGGLNPLLFILTHPESKLSMIRNATWALSNLCRGKPQPTFEAIAPAVGVLARVLSSKDTEVLTDACWALSYISDDNGANNRKIQAVIDAGICPRIVSLLAHSSTAIQVPALRTLGNIVTGDDSQTQTILNCRPLPNLLRMLSRQKKSIRKEACWAISNFTAGTPEQIQEIISNNLIPPLVALVREAEFEIQKEAAWALSNITSGGTDAQIRTLVGQAVIPALCGLFECGDSKIVMVALEGVDNILKVGQKDVVQLGGDNPFSDYVEECGGLDGLEELQRHDNEEVYNKAVEVLQKHFDSEDDEEVAAAGPVASADNSMFSFGAPAPAGTQVAAFSF